MDSAQDCFCSCGRDAYFRFSFSGVDGLFYDYFRVVYRPVLEFR